MSALYNLEPQPTAKVLLQTTSGDVLLELFAKQTPRTSRNFLQLCLDGYYNDTIFHRLVPGFVIQGGDPTGTGEGGEAIYDGGTFEDEFHSRLKFNRRGLLGMANTGKDDNGSQFFLTLGKTEELNGRNTMFGRVEGNTVYNLMKMGEADLIDGSERPQYPTKITGTEILVNPFEDMVKKAPRIPTPVLEERPEKKKPKKKAAKTLLSFEGDDGEGLGEVSVPKKAKFNPKLVAEKPLMNGTNGTGGTSKPRSTLPHREPRRASPMRKATTPSPPPKRNTKPETQLPLPDAEYPSRGSSITPEPENVAKVSSLLDQTNAQIAELKASMKRNVQTAPTESNRKKTALEQMIPANSTRGRKRKHGANGDSAQDARALRSLAAFREKLEKAAPGPSTEPQPLQGDDRHTPPNGEKAPQIESAPDDEEAQLCDLHFIANCQSCKSWDEQAGKEDNADDAIDDKTWMGHILSFEKDRLGKDLSWKRKNEDELVVIDPREKAKDIKEEARFKKAAKMGGGTRAWDRDRESGRVPERRAGDRG